LTFSWIVFILMWLTKCCQTRPPSESQCHSESPWYFLDLSFEFRLDLIVSLREWILFSWDLNAVVLNHKCLQESKRNTGNVRKNLLRSDSKSDSNEILGQFTAALFPHLS
jgi:hypothetical protein